VTREYTHGPWVDEPLSMTEHASGQPNSTYYLMKDGLGSVINILDENQTLKTTYSYDAFGQPTTTYNSGQVDCAYRFAGREFDSGMGNYFNRARYYNQSLGRFFSRDPIMSLPSGMLSNPISASGPIMAAIDPYWWWWIRQQIMKEDKGDNTNDTGDPKKKDKKEPRTGADYEQDYADNYAKKYNAWGYTVLGAAFVGFLLMMADAVWSVITSSGSGMPMIFMDPALDPDLYYGVYDGGFSGGGMCASSCPFGFSGMLAGFGSAEFGLSTDALLADLNAKFLSFQRETGNIQLHEQGLYTDGVPGRTGPRSGHPNPLSRGDWIGYHGGAGGRSAFGEPIMGCDNMAPVL